MFSVFFFTSLTYHHTSHFKVSGVFPTVKKWFIQFTVNNRLPLPAANQHRPRWHSFERYLYGFRFRFFFNANFNTTQTFPFDNDVKMILIPLLLKMNIYQCKHMLYKTDMLKIPIRVEKFVRSQKLCFFCMLYSTGNLTVNLVFRHQYRY